MLALILGFSLNEAASIGIIGAIDGPTAIYVSTKLAPHHLTYYAQDLASDFHAFYRDCRVLSSDPADAELTRARLKLVRATKGVLARVLDLMGMSAPESM